MPLFSIVTPCYNSEKTLWRTYKSLLQQQSDLFEWILIDDASNDCNKTINLIDEIEKKAPFAVKKIFLKNNFFSSRSVYEGCKIANGKYIAILDHDDQLVPNILVVVKNYIESIDSMEDVAGICGRCVNEENILMGKYFYPNKLIANEGDIRFKKKITEELFQFSKVDVIKPFFKLMKPGFTNGYVWSAVSRTHNYLYVNDVFRIYDTVISTSYSNTKSLLIKFPEAKAEALRFTIMCYRGYLKFNIFYASKLIGSYLRHNINARVGVFRSIEDFDFILKIWSLLIYPFALLKSKGLI